MTSTTFWQFYCGIGLCVALIVSTFTEDMSYWNRFVLSVVVGTLWAPLLFIFMIP